MYNLLFCFIILYNMSCTYIIFIRAYTFCIYNSLKACIESVFVFIFYYILPSKYYGIIGLTI